MARSTVPWARTGDAPLYEDALAHEDAANCPEDRDRHIETVEGATIGLPAAVDGVLGGDLRAWRRLEGRGLTMCGTRHADDVAREQAARLQARRAAAHGGRPGAGSGPATASSAIAADRDARWPTPRGA
ncbi:hypothetical protein ACIBEA_41285 [Streptomyces sp. NPDC051555]|uniref:hypothetical protein n=1 Tax=Streptomyces sp. NPDC051555 TaxID=3365657 RepID=UPI0037B691E0